MKNLIWVFVYRAGPLWTWRLKGCPLGRFAEWSTTTSGGSTGVLLPRREFRALQVAASKRRCPGSQDRGHAASRLYFANLLNVF